MRWRKHHTPEETAAARRAIREMKRLTRGWTSNWERALAGICAADIFHSLPKGVQDEVQRLAKEGES